jgi:hypothetical protein
MTDYFDGLEAELHAAVPRAARRRPHVHLRVPTPGRLGLGLVTAVPLAIAVLALVLLAHPSTPAVRSLTGGATPGPTPAPAPFALLPGGNGLGEVQFGAPRQQVVAALRPRLGSPHAPAQTAGCGISQTLSWELTLVLRDGRVKHNDYLRVAFTRGRFAGYQLGGNAPEGQSPRQPAVRVRATTLQTAGGLAVGDTLGRGRRLYGGAFRVLNVKGGSWKVRTPRGTLSGYARTHRFPLTSNAVVGTIDAGHIGCPVVSP